MSDLSHGLLLLDQGRLEEAEACFVQILTRDPGNDYVHSRLAVCRMPQRGRKKDALKSIDHAIKLNPDSDHYHGLRSLILSDLHRFKDAIEAADLAISMNPNSSSHYAAKAAAFCEVHRWAEAEAFCREALAINPDDSLANHLLTNALRLQGKTLENKTSIDHQLAENPENAYAHANAGWGALHQGDHSKAEDHFREALRLNPEVTGAREGLLESFKARSWFYRIYLSYCFFMQRFTFKVQLSIILIVYLSFQLLRIPLSKLGQSSETIVIGLWFGLIMFIWLAPGIGNFLINLDHSARNALRINERCHGIWVGWALIAGIPLLLIGWLKEIPGVIPLGAMVLTTTIPASLAFSTQSSKDRRIFTSVIALVVGLGLTCAMLEITGSHQKQMIDNLLITMIIVGALSSWLGNLPHLRRDDSG